MTRSIGGTLRYDLLAQQHKPSDPSAIAAEVQRLSEQGLKARDIAAALNLHVEVVLRTLQVPA